MKALAESTGATYVHVLQPNQYVAGSKSFTRRELEVAYNPENPWSQIASRGYPLLQARAADLRRAGVAFYDLTSIFENETETIYKDPCCHVNQRGNQIFGREVARAVAETLRDRR